MALTITSITPNVGVTAGWTRVTIEGTDFDIHPYPPAVTGYVGKPDPWPSVKVKFGHLYAPENNLWIYPKPGGAPDEFVIECSTPRFLGNHRDLPKAVDVVVENQINPGSVIAVDGFTYHYADVTNNSVLKLVTAGVLSELARQITVKDVVQRVHTDYDESTGDQLNLVKIADVPALLVRGPTIVESPDPYNTGYHESVKQLGPNDRRRYRASSIRDLEYEITIIDEHLGRLLNIANLLTNFVDENGQLIIEQVPGDPTQGYVEVDVDWVTNIAVDPDASNDNLSTAIGTLVVRGIPIDRCDQIELEKTTPIADDGINIGIDTDV